MSSKFSSIRSLKVLYNIEKDAFIENIDLISPRRIISLLILSLVSAQFISGVVFGISALKDTLIYRLGAFSDLCSSGDSIPCTAQSEKITFVFTIATSCSCFTSLFVGILLDYAGPRLSLCLWSFVFAAGLAILACAKYVSDGFYILGFCALGISGPTCIAATINFADLFKSKAQLLVSIQSGLFQTSSIMIVAIVYVINNFGLTFQFVLLSYMLVPLAIFVAGFFLCPDHVYGSGQGHGHHGEPHRIWLIKRMLKADDSQNAEFYLSHSLQESLEDEEGVSNSIRESEIPLLAPLSEVKQPPELFNVDIWTQIKSYPFWVIAATTGFYVLNLTLYIATIEDQLLKDSLLSGNSEAVAEADASELTSLFNLILPIGSAVGIPLSSWLLYRKGLPSSFALSGFLNITFLMFTIPDFIPLRFKAIGFFIFALNRTILFCSIMNYITEIFGFENVGRLFGLVSLIGSIEIPIELVAESVNSYIWVNVSLMVLSLGIAVLIPLFLVSYLFSGFFFRPDMPVRS